MQTLSCSINVGLLLLWFLAFFGCCFVSAVEEKSGMVWWEEEEEEESGVVEWEEEGGVVQALCCLSILRGGRGTRGEEAIHAVVTHVSSCPSLQEKDHTSVRFARKHSNTSIT